MSKKYNSDKPPKLNRFGNKNMAGCVEKYIETSKDSSEKQDMDENPPEFDRFGTERLIDYMKRVDRYNNVVLKNRKYNMILNFIHKWLNYDDKKNLPKSLKGFKNISEYTLLDDPKYNRKILRKYGPKLSKELDIKFNIDDETASEEIKETYILYFVSKILNSIGYTLVRREVEKKNKKRKNKKYEDYGDDDYECLYSIKEHKKSRLASKKKDRVRRKMAEMKKIRDMVHHRRET